MSRVTISMKAARKLEWLVSLLAKGRGFSDEEADALAELRRAMKSEPKRQPPDAAGIALARELKRRANATRRAVGLAPLLSKPRRAPPDASRSDRRDETAVIRITCLKRADGWCECGCGRAVWDDCPDMNAKAELDHVFSRGKGARLPQAVETCWILRRDCHRERTNNRPDAATWWRKFIRHTDKHNAISPHDRYFWAREAAAARLAFVETRSMLGAGLKERKP